MIDYLKEKLHVEYGDGLKESNRVLSRKYTLTHSDETGELFLYVAESYACDRLTDNRDDVLGQWKKVGDKKVLIISLHLDSEVGKSIEERDVIFRKELPLALKAIIYGERKLYMNNKDLINSPIVVYFNSSNSKYNKIERWGRVKDYIVTDSRADLEKRALYPDIKSNVIVALLRPYIEKELKKLYGSKFIFCERFSKILSITPLKSQFSCEGRYSIVLVIKTGFNLISKEMKDVIIEFNITNDGVKVVSTKEVE